MMTPMYRGNDHLNANAVAKNCEAHDNDGSSGQEYVVATANNGQDDDYKSDIVEQAWRSDDEGDAEQLVG